MKIETLLNAMDLTKIRLTSAFHGINDATVEDVKRYSRQHAALRSRILARDKEKDHLLNEWERIVGGTSAGDVFRDNVRELEK